MTLVRVYQSVGLLEQMTSDVETLQLKSDTAESYGSEDSTARQNAGSCHDENALNVEGVGSTLLVCKPGYSRVPVSKL